MNNRQIPHWLMLNRLSTRCHIDGVLGASVIVVLLLARGLGWLQPLEWKALDYGLRWRPAETVDPRITIVGIDDADLQRLDSYPVPDQALADLLQTLKPYQPQVIGVDIFRDRPVPPGHEPLNQALGTMSNVVWIDAIATQGADTTIPAPNILPAEQVGFANATLDQDGFLRRSLLGSYTVAGEYRLSLTIQIAARYLEAEGLSLENGMDDPVAMRFGTTELPRVRSKTGGYVRAPISGNQILLNYRSGPTPFHKVTLSDVLEGRVASSLLRDRIVLVGLTALSNKDVINTDAIAGATPGLIYGIEIQAHAISQILSAVLDGRPLLQAWSDPLEYLWIVSWGLIGIVLGRLTQVPTRQFAAVLGISTGLIAVGYGGLLIGQWIPTAPALLVFILNGVAVYSFYLYDRNLRAQVQERQKVIEYTFDTIHNGPLQTLAQLVRENHDRPGLSDQLQTLNQDIRDVYDAVRHETLAQGSQVLRTGTRTYDLRGPLHEVLYDIYLHTLERPFPCFQGLKIKVIQFDSLEAHHLGIEERREICRFFEEALCNVGKYAQAATKLTINIGKQGQYNLISVEDNGSSPSPRLNREKHQGRGTSQALAIARRLGGEFDRYPRPSKGTVCELKWGTSRPWWYQFRASR